VAAPRGGHDRRRLQSHRVRYGPTRPAPCKAVRTSIDSYVGSAVRIGRAIGEHGLVAALAGGGGRNVGCWRLSARGLLDQEDAIAVGVAEVRHRWHGTLAAHHVLELDAA
jgi:hypothetical protein